MEIDFDRVSRYEPSTATGGRPASVLVPVVDTEPSLVFTKRAEELPDHPGQMSFPGGRREPGDRSRLATACREADEEIGLAADELAVAGRLDDIRTVTDFTVRPYVVRVPDREYEPTSPEVAAVAVLPVAALTDPGNYTVETREDRRIEYFRVDGYTVWGATARILGRLLVLTTDWERERAQRE